MKKLLHPFFLLAVLQSQGQRQEFTLSSLLNTASLPGEQFAAYISRKGFKPQPAGTIQAFYKISKDKSREKLIEKTEKASTAQVLYQTSLYDEFRVLNRELQEEGYHFSPTQKISADAYALYQKGNITVKPQIKKEGTKESYCFLIERTQLPQRSSIVYAEDLLQLQAHEHLAAVYGSANVRKEVFYFSETEVSKCSILFPQTAMQVIFIWKDEEYNRGISMLIFGGRSAGRSSRSFYKTVEWSKWKSRQGLYPGMPLKELEQQNGNCLTFYGWESEDAGFVLRDNKGKIDFKKIGVQLDCLDCNEDRFYSSTNVLNSATLIQQNRQVFVSTLLLIPQY